MKKKIMNLVCVFGIIEFLFLYLICLTDIIASSISGKITCGLIGTGVISIIGILIYAFMEMERESIEQENLMKSVNLNNTYSDEFTKVYDKLYKENHEEIEKQRPKVVKTLNRFYITVFATLISLLIIFNLLNIFIEYDAIKFYPMFFFLIIGVFQVSNAWNNYVTSKKEYNEFIKEKVIISMFDSLFANSKYMPDNYDAQDEIIEEFNYSNFYNKKANTVHIEDYIESKINNDAILKLCELNATEETEYSDEDGTHTSVKRIYNGMFGFTNLKKEFIVPIKIESINKTEKEDESRLIKIDSMEFE